MSGVRVFTGVMTENAPELADIHDRSPVILAPEWHALLSLRHVFRIRLDRHGAKALLELHPPRLASNGCHPVNGCPMFRPSDGG